ncbi:hypothetical protein [PinkBerry-associated phage LS06-2018-MD08]|nr:hypothetical protein [PinkBerry-associated phage LS06-2018-MD08]
MNKDMTALEKFEEIRDKVLNEEMMIVEAFIHIRNIISKQTLQPTNIDNEVEEAINGIAIQNACGKYDYDNIENCLDTIRKALTTPTKSAKEMFEELGYEYERSATIITCTRFNGDDLTEYIEFGIKRKGYEAYRSNPHRREVFPKIVYKEEHQAITQQLKELEE